MKKVIYASRLKFFFLPLPKRAKAWAPLTYNLLAGSKSYFFKNQCFFVCANEAALYGTNQVEVLWRSTRRYTRRFPINFRRLPAVTRIQLTATKTKNKRKKGGRMGSGKSPFENLQAPLTKGQIFLWISEFRFTGTNTFAHLRSLIKKNSVKCKIKYSR